MHCGRVHCDVACSDWRMLAGDERQASVVGSRILLTGIYSIPDLSAACMRLHAVTPLASPLNVLCLEWAICDWSGSQTKCFCSVWFCRTQQLSAGVAASVIWQLLIAAETQTRATLCSWHLQLYGKNKSSFVSELNIYLFYATTVVQPADKQGFWVCGEGEIHLSLTDATKVGIGWCYWCGSGKRDCCLRWAQVLTWGEGKTVVNSKRKGVHNIECWLMTRINEGGEK